MFQRNTNAAAPYTNVLHSVTFDIRNTLFNGSFNSYQTLQMSEMKFHEIPKLLQFCKTILLSNSAQFYEIVILKSV